jgi:hypothetical protein
MNELFPAPVIPITAITISGEFELMLADYALAETMDLGLTPTPNNYLAPSPGNFAIGVWGFSAHLFDS